jgi:YD repeat-containing protein
LHTNAGGSLTTWNYHTQRGFLLNKRDADGKGADYTYTLAGRLLTRDWERGVTTTYGYGAGMLETTVYSDSTLGVTQTYDNFGRPVETSNTVAKTTYAYDAATLVLNTETVSYDIDGDSTYELTGIIARHQDGLLRPTGFLLIRNSSYTQSREGLDSQFNDFWIAIAVCVPEMIAPSMEALVVWSPQIQISFILR